MQEVVKTFVEEFSGWIATSLTTIIILTIFYFLGLFADYAKSAGILIRSRLKLLISSIVYAFIFVVSLLICIRELFFLLVADPLTFFQKALELGPINIALIFIALFMVIVGIGALAIYIINIHDTNFLRAFKLSAMLATAPIQEFIYALSFLLILLLYYPLILVLSQTFHSWIPQLPADVFFIISWCIFTIALYFAGPSKVLYYAFLFASASIFAFVLVVFIICLFPIFIPILILALPLLIPLLIFLVIIAFILMIVGGLIGALGIVRSIGLFTFIISILLYIGSQWILSTINELGKTPLVAYIVSYLQPALFVISQFNIAILILGLFIGIILLFFGREVEKEEKSLISLSMAIAAACALILYFGILQLIPQSLETIKIPILNEILSFSRLSITFYVSLLFLPIFYLIIIFVSRILYGVFKLLKGNK